MKVLVLLAALTGLSGCVTPDRWSAQTHNDMMRQCSLSCGENRMTGYDAWSAKCQCRESL